MQVIEHWWNGSWAGLYRRDLRLQFETSADPNRCPYEDTQCVRAGACVYTGERCAGGIWQLWVRYGRDDQTRDYRDETDARKALDTLLDPEYGPWQQVR